MRDPYLTLGLPRDANQDEVKSAYRRLAKKHHPDLHPNDDKVAEKFKDISAAYDILGDEKKRKEYDSGYIDADGNQTAKGKYHGAGFGSHGAGPGAGDGIFTDFSEFFGGGMGGGPFGDMFGQKRPHSQGFSQRGEDHTFKLTVDFEDAVKGVKKRVDISYDKTVEVKVPAGIKDGQVIRLKGQGHPGFGGAPSGDALIEVAIKPHPYFRREGDDIYLDLPITLKEAVLGEKVKVPTIDNPVQITIPRGASSGTKMRLKHKGVHTNKGRGDQYVVLQIMLPKGMDRKLEEFVAEWEPEDQESPRKKAGME